MEGPGRVGAHILKQKKVCSMGKGKEPPLRALFYDSCLVKPDSELLGGHLRVNIGRTFTPANV